MGYIGKIRIFVHKIDTLRDGFELSDHCDFFDDTLISDVDGCSNAEVLSEEIASTGFDIFTGSIQTVLKKYALHDVVEIIGDAYLESSTSWTDCGYEYDVEGWLENERHRKLTPEQTKRFAADFDEVEESSEVTAGVPAVTPSNA